MGRRIHFGRKRDDGTVEPYCGAWTGSRDWTTLAKLTTCRHCVERLIQRDAAEEAKSGFVLHVDFAADRSGP